MIALSLGDPLLSLPYKALIWARQKPQNKRVNIPLLDPHERAVGLPNESSFAWDDGLPKLDPESQDVVALSSQGTVIIRITIKPAIIAMIFFIELIQSAKLFLNHKYSQNPLRPAIMNVWKVNHLSKSRKSPDIVLIHHWMYRYWYLTGIIC